MTKVTGDIYQVQLRGLVLIKVIPTAVEGSQSSYSQKKREFGAASDEYSRVSFKLHLIIRTGIQ